MTATHEPIRILALSGSLRHGSINTAILRAAARLARWDATVTVYDGLRALPPFDPDLDAAGIVADPVLSASLRAAVEALADAVA